MKHICKERYNKFIIDEVWSNEPYFYMVNRFILKYYTINLTSTRFSLGNEIVSMWNNIKLELLEQYIERSKER